LYDNINLNIISLLSLIFLYKTDKKRANRRNDNLIAHKSSRY